MIDAGFNVTSNIAGLAGLAGANGAQPKTAREAAEAFEAVFLSQMLAQMFSGLASDGPFSGGYSEQIYRSILTDEYGATMAKRGGVGIADALERELLKLQEVE